MLWFLKDQRRVDQERAAVSALGEASPWLNGARWTFREGALAIDLDLLVHGKAYEATLLYPDLFPLCPPTVRPRDASQRWSSHQYLDGTLCLEWGQDTWLPEVTGAQVIESLHRLLEIEHPPEGERVVAPSRHLLTQGQTLRSSWIRFYVTTALLERLGPLRAGSRGTLSYGSLFDCDRELDVVLGLIDTSGEWSDPTLPSGWRGSAFCVWKRTGVFYAVSANSVAIERIASCEALQALLQSEITPDLVLNSSQDRLGVVVPDEVTRVLVRSGEGNLHLFRVCFGEDQCSAVAVTNQVPTALASRLPVEHGELATSKVGIVGLGSLGGRIAVSLARSGVKHFVLVDDDVLLPGNVCRHVLDWRGVLAHKTQGVADALDWIAPGVTRRVFSINLTGQESSAATAQALDALAGCNLNVDATANASVFNLLAGISADAGKPLVWGEVFAGGIGGFIAQHRPGKGPSAHEIRAGYHTFCLEHPVEGVQRAAGDYGVVPDGSEAAPLVAVDAEVSLIAGHMSRLVIDCLLQTEPPLFAEAAYLVGLRRAWIFEAPFHTIPLRIESSAAAASQPLATVPETLEFLVGLLHSEPTHEGSASVVDPA